MRMLISLVCSLAVGSVAAAQTPTRFTVETSTATISDFELVRLEVGGKLHGMTAGTARTLPSFVGLRRDGAQLSGLPARNFALLTNGDRIPLDAEATALLEDGRLRVWPSAALPTAQAKGLSVFAPYFVLLFWSLPDGVDDAELFLARLEKETRKRDVLYLKNGDRIEGLVTGLSAKDGCTIASGDRKLQTPWAKIAGIAWNTDRQARLRTKKTHWRAVLDGGARLNLLDVRLDEKSRRWHGVTQFGAALDWPEAAVLALDSRQGDAVDLADLTPARYEHRPYLGIAWPLALDACATGHSLRMAGSTFERGLGMHAACEVAFKLDGEYQRFLATVGIDERSRRGKAKAAVLLDGKRIELNDGAELTSQTPPILVRLDVGGVRTLTLVVDFGTLGDVQANVNWANARLVKK